MYVLDDFFSSDAGKPAKVIVGVLAVVVLLLLFLFGAYRYSAWMNAANAAQTSAEGYCGGNGFYGGLCNTGAAGIFSNITYPAYAPTCGARWGPYRRKNCGGLTGGPMPSIDTPYDIRDDPWGAHARPCCRTKALVSY